MSEIIHNRKLADFANVAVGKIVSDAEYAQLLAAFNAERDAADEARYQAALLDAKPYESIVERTWSRNGMSLRRGTIVRFRRLVLGDVAVYHREPGKQGSKHGIWSCGLEELREHCSSAKQRGDGEE